MIRSTNADANRRDSSSRGFSAWQARSGVWPAIVVLRLNSHWRGPAIFLAALIAYANSLSNQFALDDIPIVQKNYRIRSLAHPERIWATSYWGSDQAAPAYRPVTLFSYALNFAVAKRLTGDGTNPIGYHLVNILLHGLVSCMAAWLASSLFQSQRLGLFTGLLFALHPIHTEVAAGIVGRAELLASAGFFLALLCWRRIRNASTAPRIAFWAIAAGAAFASGLFSKESCITLIGVALFEFIVWRRMEQPAGRGDPLTGSLALRSLICLFALAVAALGYLVARHAVLGGLIHAESSTVSELANVLTTAPLDQRLLTAARIQGACLWQLVWPARLVADYSFNAEPVAESFGEPGVWLSLTAMAALGALFIAAWRKAPAVSFAIGFYILTISLTANILFPIGTIRAERLLYLPSFGFCLAAAWLFDRLWSGARQRRTRAAVGVAFAATLAAYLARTMVRNPAWRDNLALFTATVKQVPNCFNAQCTLGRALAERDGREDEARRRLEIARSILPANTSVHLGLAYIARKQTIALAARGDRAALDAKFREIEDLLTEAYAIAPRDRDVCRLYGLFLCERGRFDEGLPILEQAHAIDSYDLEPIRQLAICYSIGAANAPERRDERLDKALHFGALAMDLDPDDGQVAGFYGMALKLSGRPEAAYAILSEAVRLQGAAADVNLRILHAEAALLTGRYDEAEILFRALQGEYPKDPRPADFLARIGEARAASE